MGPCFKYLLLSLMKTKMVDVILESDKHDRVVTPLSVDLVEEHKNLRPTTTNIIFI